VQRIISGAAVNELEVKVNGDFHQFRFSGVAKDAIDSASFSDGEGGLTAWPDEPAVGAFDHGVIPGHLGQVWLGVEPNRFFSLTEATLRLENGIEERNREFGSPDLRLITPGERSVTLDFELYATDEDSVKELYQAARMRSPVQVMFQLGLQAGQLFGAYMKSVVLETPEFDDNESRLVWRFRNCRAQGSSEDELVIAFG
jgi:hypothetical protein